MAFIINIYKYEDHSQLNKEEIRADFDIVRKEIGPTKKVEGNKYSFDHNEPIGDISKASKIRIGIKPLNLHNDCQIFFA